MRSVKSSMVTARSAAFRAFEAVVRAYSGAPFQKNGIDIDALIGALRGMRSPAAYRLSIRNGPIHPATHPPIQASVGYFTRPSLRRSDSL